MSSNQILDLINEITQIHNLLCSDKQNNSFLAGYKLNYLQSNLVNYFKELYEYEKNAIARTDSIEEIKE